MNQRINFLACLALLVLVVFGSGCASLQPPAGRNPYQEQLDKPETGD